MAPSGHEAEFPLPAGASVAVRISVVPPPPVVAPGAAGPGQPTPTMDTAAGSDTVTDAEAKDRATRAARTVVPDCQVPGCDGRHPIDVDPHRPRSFTVQTAAEFFREHLLRQKAELEARIAGANEHIKALSRMVNERSNQKARAERELAAVNTLLRASESR